MAALTAAAVLGAAAISAGGQTASSGLNAWMQWLGMNAQKRENRRAEKLQLKIRGEDIKREGEIRGEEVRFRERGFQNQLQEQKYNKYMNFIGGFGKALAQNQNMKNNLVNFWQSQRGT